MFSKQLIEGYIDGTLECTSGDKWKYKLKLSIENSCINTWIYLLYRLLYWIPWIEDYLSIVNHILLLSTTLISGLKN